MALIKMWRLSRIHNMPPYVQFGDFDEIGRPIVYKDDLDALTFVDELEEDGKAHQHWLESKKGGR